MTSASAPVRPDDVGAFIRTFRRFRDWCQRRPFWGGLLAIIAGLPILYFPYAHLSLGGLTFAMATTGGAGALIIGVLMMVLGVSVWVQPMTRVFAGVATILLALVSIPVSNLGGFGFGLVPGLIGGGLMAAWAPLKEPAAPAPVKSVTVPPPPVAPPTAVPPPAAPPTVVPPTDGLPVQRSGAAEADALGGSEPGEQGAGAAGEAR
ncbi:DUF6114 domain-containing protein [Peterkaempfera bronchialis]|uniref:DUF6114 domain-containing protein n=1 Tax=Peterkaempfera bronchialis TaxID=2126346 RepID=UPI001E5A014D|nr:DUF6114 domain-containing protein [Peterkaempfera bronchialis]